MEAYWTNGICRLFQADARDIPLPDESVQCVMTSPPYWGLRDYKLEPQIWDGNPECPHDFSGEIVHEHREQGSHGKSRTTERFYGGDPSRRFNGDHERHFTTQFCVKCHAWKGTLGLEPTPDLYVQHIVECFREVRRTLRSDGVVFLNLGDSYAGSGIHSSHHANPGLSRAAEPGGDVATPTPPGLKPKDLCGIPWRVAFALQADGWWLRSDIIWVKPNPMPESVTDRPTRSHEYLFLLTKSADYYWDQEAVRELSMSGPSDITKMLEHRERIGGKHKFLVDPLSKASSATNIGQHRSVGDPSGRNLRSVWQIATQPFGLEMCQACGKIYTGAQHRRLPTVGYQMLNAETEEMEEHEGKRCNRCKAADAWSSHFATFPEKLVEPCVLAGTSEKGCCPGCGAPWERVMEKQSGVVPESWHQSRFDDGRNAEVHPNVGKRTTMNIRVRDAKRGVATAQEGYGASQEEIANYGEEQIAAYQTVGWEPTCACGREDTQPCLVLDPFAGSGTVPVVAQKLGCHAVGLDLSEAYLNLAVRRLEGVPLPLRAMKQ